MVSVALAWILFLGIVLSLLALDLFVLHRKPHAIQFKEALIGALIPIVVAFGFTAVIYYGYQLHWFDLGIVPEGVPKKDLVYWPTTGGAAVMAYLTGYLIELSLSADNVFLFLVLMSFFVVPPALQHRVLFWGVLGALVMRGIMIVAGAALIASFHWVIYLFGAFLIYTGIKMMMPSESEADPGKSLAVRWARKMFPVRDEYVGKAFFVKEKIVEEQAGKTQEKIKWVATRLFLVLVCIEFTDLVFALDSIPAIFGITQDPFIVFTSNVFAILGLRSMYFLLAGVMGKFHLLKYGLAFVLAFVGVKMLLPLAGEIWEKYVSHQDEHWHMDSRLSLVIILLALAASIVASLMFPAKKAA